MDTITQGTLGAVYAQTIADKKTKVSALLIGSLAGMAPDLDVLIRSSVDPLLAIEYHRHFTHSIFFIPIGALIVSMLLHPFFKKKISFKKNYIFSILGYATHGLLDACTTYGTQLLWPFSSQRFAWNNVSIIDPLYTIPLIILIILNLKFNKKIFPQLAVLFSIFYLLLGVWQNKQAKKLGENLANQRGLNAIRIDAKPSFGNLFLWRIIVETEDYFYVDAVRVLTSHTFYEGQKIKKFKISKDLPDLKSDTLLYKDIEKFNWFSDQYLAWHPEIPNVLGDIRYSFLPNEINPLWGIVLKKENEHVDFQNFRNLKKDTLNKFYQMLAGKNVL